MTPTNRLRFVERAISHHGQDKIIRILQQWWEEAEWVIDGPVVIDGEWRDVPLEVEE